MVLDKSKYFFSFSNNLETLLSNYIKKKKHEIFIGLLGKISGKKRKINYEIKDLIPFPNLSDRPDILATPPEHWLSIIEEKRDLLNNNYKFLGFIHSHPDKSSKKSKLDDDFSLNLYRAYGSKLMIIIGYKLTLRCYLIDEDKTKLINGVVNTFKVKIK